MGAYSTGENTMMDIISQEYKKYIDLHNLKKGYGVHTKVINDGFRGNEQIKNNIHDVLVNSKHVIDIGCSRGAIYKYLKVHYPYIVTTCLDIAADELNKENLGFRVIQASCHDMPFYDDTFDLVLHIDGLEHIPVELEEQTFIEERRISDKYVYHQICIVPVKEDLTYIRKGLGAIHINLKSIEDWYETFRKYCLKYPMKLVSFTAWERWVFVLLEKI